MTEGLRDRLESLRALLYEDPSAHVWQQIIKSFETWPVSDLLLGIDYAQEHLTHWPDQLRVVPIPWIKALVKGGKRRRKKKRIKAPRHISALCLTRCLHWHKSSIGHQEWMALDRCKALAPWITHLSLPEHQDAPGLLRGLVDMRHFTALRSLDLSLPRLYNHKTCRWDSQKHKDLCVAALTNPLLHQLTSLDVNGYRLGEVAAGCVLSVMPALCHLNLALNDLSEGFLRQFFEESCLDLHYLDLSFHGELAGVFFEMLKEPFLFPSLRRFGLAGCSLDDQHVSTLLEWEGLKRLECFALRHNTFSPENQKLLREAFGGVVLLEPQRSIRRDEDEPRMDIFPHEMVLETS